MVKSMKVIKRIFTIVITIILVAIFTLNVYNIINIKYLKKDITPVFGYTMLEVVSGSMEPEIQVGDIVIIDVLAKDYKINDIVTFKEENGAMVTHRIISIDGNKMVTKGDSNNTADPENTTDNIVGKYVGKIRGLGRILSSLKSPVTMILILVIGVLTCILVSTDKNGNPIDDKDEDEFQEFLEMKKTAAKKEQKNKINKKSDDKDLKEKKEKNNIKKSDKTTKTKSKDKNTTKEKNKSSNRKIKK